jgi:hypothetical protein
MCASIEVDIFDSVCLYTPIQIDICMEAHRGGLHATRLGMGRFDGSEGGGHAVYTLG